MKLLHKFEVCCWYVWHVFIIFDYSMLVLYQCHMFLLSYYIIFRHLYWTNLLTRCPVPVPVFPVFLFLDNLLRKNTRNWTNLWGFFIEQMKKWRPEPKGRLRGQPTGQGQHVSTAPLGPAGGTRLCPSGTPSAASDAYKITPDKKTLTHEGFSQIRDRPRTRSDCLKLMTIFEVIHLAYGI